MLVLLLRSPGLSELRETLSDLPRVWASVYEGGGPSCISSDARSGRPAPELGKSSSAAAFIVRSCRRRSDLPAYEENVEPFAASKPGRTGVEVLELLPPMLPISISRCSCSGGASL